MHRKIRLMAAPSSKKYTPDTFISEWSSIGGKHWMNCQVLLAMVRWIIVYEDSDRHELLFVTSTSRKWFIASIFSYSSLQGWPTKPSLQGAFSPSSHLRGSNIIFPSKWAGDRISSCFSKHEIRKECLSLRCSSGSLTQLCGWKVSLRISSWMLSEWLGMV